MNRKDFIQASCSALGLGILAQLGAACSSYKIFKTTLDGAVIRIPVSEFLVESTRVVRVQNLEYDILVQKIEPNLFSAVLLKCTHHDWNLVAGKSAIHCTAHGSQFDWLGNVMAGPATQHLKRYQTRIENDFLILT